MSDDHPPEGTRGQTRQTPDDWAQPAGADFEPSDAPFGAVAKGLALGGVVLVLVIGAILLVSRWIAGPPQLDAPAAAAQFRAPAPPLLAEPRRALADIERDHPAPAGARLERAMDEVVAAGWGSTTPPPGRAATALARARSRQ